MKNFLSIVVLFFVISTSCQNHEDFVVKESGNIYRITDEQYYKIISKTDVEINQILAKTKPNNLSIAEYKIMLLNGKFSLTNEQQKNIEVSIVELVNYGKSSIIKNNINIDTTDLSSVIAFAGTNSPSSINQRNSKRDLTQDDFVRCGVVALGGDALWALAGSSASVWTAAAAKTAFSAIARRFLGPVGVAIAVVSFGVCLGETYYEAE